MFPRPWSQSWPRVAFVQHTQQWWLLDGFSVAADASREAPGAGLAGRDRGDAEAEFVQGRLVPIKRPVLEGRAPVVAQSGPRQTCKFVCKAQRFGQCLTGLDEAVGESDR